MLEFDNVFLIRNPKDTILSLFSSDPKFNIEETGYKELYHYFLKVKNYKKKTPLVIDSDDLIKNPTTTIKQFCSEVNIPFIKESLAWNPGIPSDFIWWEGGGNWIENVANSSGFYKKIKSNNHLKIEDNKKLKEAYDFCKPYYEAIANNKKNIN